MDEFAAAGSLAPATATGPHELCAKLAARAIKRPGQNPFDCYLDYNSNMFNYGEK
jgi:hypothetical protein